jgi:hypothetical protein
MYKLNFSAETIFAILHCELLVFVLKGMLHGNETTHKWPTWEEYLEKMNKSNLWSSSLASCCTQESHIIGIGIGIIAMAGIPRFAGIFFSQVYYYGHVLHNNNDFLLHSNMF